MSRSLTVLRESIATCHSCFPTPQCRHHEGAVGGYAKGRVVIVGINPQGSTDDVVYRAIEQDLSWQERNLLGDRVLDLFARVARLPKRNAAQGVANEARKVFSDSPALATLPFHAHGGIRGWLPRVVRGLDTTPEVLRDHVTIVESVKHTTANEAELRDFADLSKMCHRWLKLQLAHLEPRGVIFTGNRGLTLAHALGVTGLPPAGRITNVHGHSGTWSFAELGRSCDALVTLAFSGNSSHAWKRHVEQTKAAQRWFASRVDTDGDRPSPSDQGTVELLRPSATPR